MLHISGAEYGYVITKKEYSNYHLRAEFKWGEATHPPRPGLARDSGILFHVAGPNQIWPTSIEFQMIEGGTGDIILVGSTTTATRDGITKTRARFDRRNKSPLPDRQLYVAGYRDPKMEYENPHGQWNVLDLFADGDSFKYLVNGKVDHLTPIGNLYLALESGPPTGRVARVYPDDGHIAAKNEREWGPAAWKWLREQLSR